MTRPELAVLTINTDSLRNGDGSEKTHKPDVSMKLSRVMDASLEKVYAAWTDPKIMQRWFAPGDSTVTNAVANVVVGGTFLVEIRAADGKVWRTRGVYREVEPLRRLVHTWAWEGSDMETLVTVEFEPDLAGKTRLTLTHSRFTQVETRDEHVHGWTGCLSKLEILCRE